MRVNTQRIKSPTKVQLQFHLSPRITLFVTAPLQKGIKPRNACDPDDHLASIRRMSFPKFKITLRSSSTLPSVFLPDNMEPYPLRMKLHPSLLLNKYAHSFQTKPQGHM
jgi:hypothetical protein